MHMLSVSETGVSGHVTFQREMQMNSEQCVGDSLTHHTGNKINTQLNIQQANYHK